MRIGICGNYGVSNIGDEAILKGLKLLCERNFPGCEIIVFGQGSLFPLGIRSFFRAIFETWLWTKPYKAIKSCDMFILGGGGLFSDEEGFFIPIFWSLHGFIAYWAGKAPICMGISVGSLNWLNQIIVKALFKRARTIVVRDRYSYDLIIGWGIKCVLSSDLALLLSNDKSALLPAKEISGEKYMVISARQFKNIDDNLYTILAQLCDYVSSEFGLHIKLIPFKGGNENDSIVLNKIFEQCKQKSFVSITKYYDDVDKLIDVLRNSTMVVGLRLHSGILSLVAGVPFLPLAYMSKINNFWGEFKEIEVLDISTIDFNRLVNAFDRIFTDRDKYIALSSNIRNILMKRIVFPVK